MSTSESQLSRRAPRFRLHTLLVLVTVIGVVFALIANELHSVHRQKQAAEEVRRRGGHVRLMSLDDQPKNTGLVSGWLRLVLGDEYFLPVIHVSLPVRSEEDLDILHAFKEAPSLNLGGAAVTDAALERLSSLTQIEDLRLAGGVISERGTKSLAALPNLRRLSFESCSLSDDSLKPLAALPNLHLSLGNSSVSDEALKAFRGSRSSVGVRLTETNKTETEILALRDAIPTLTISLFGKQTMFGSRVVEENYLPSVQQLPDVKDLAFSGHFITDATLAILKDARSQTNLKIDRCRVSDDGLRNLSSLSQLRTLYIVGIDEPDTAMAKARQSPEISNLTRPDGQITDRGLEQISHLTNLTDLTIYGCEITDGGVRHLQPLQNLTSLYLGGMPITDDGVRELRVLRKLRSLDLTHTKIQGHGLRSLESSITWLNLDHTDVTDGGLGDIAQLTSVTNLLLGSTRITDDGVSQLARMTSLRSLVVTTTQLTDRSIEHFCQLPLEKLNVSSTQMTQDGVKRLFNKRANRQLGKGLFCVTVTQLILEIGWAAIRRRS